MNKGGGGSSRNQFCNNEIRAGKGSERSKQVGVTGVGNTTPTNKGGGCSSRNQFCNNEIRAESGSEYVGIADSFNGPGQGGLNFSDNKVIAGERCKQVGVTGVGNTRPTKAPAGAASYSLGEEEAERSQLKKDMINRKKK
ncbi:uncharacterized protein LOC117613449 isoform X1 [Prunus dulcis]|uniref:uncharacterized protein LOC117613449 isoform X1 n=1 Tax=Prunus dulcis TaxID=3755 RepID=UPI0014838C95|nr:uncharacterized protein LOC117613449 isoform X1 [Prunus dulcis]